MIEFQTDHYLEDMLEQFPLALKNSLRGFFSERDVLSALDDNNIDYLFHRWGLFSFNTVPLTIILTISGVNWLSGVSSVPRAAFLMTDLSKITLPNNILRIAESAFQNCSDLLSVYIPISVTSIGRHAFAGCWDLYEIDYEGTKEDWDKIVKTDFWHSGRSLYIKCSDGEIKLEDDE